MSREKLLEILEAHQEFYDWDCGEHFGCRYCKAVGPQEGQDVASEIAFATTADSYRQHLANMILKELQ